MNAQKIMRQIKDHLYRSAPKIGSKCVSKSEKAYLISEQRVFWNLIVAVGLVNEKSELEMTSVLQREKRDKRKEFLLVYDLSELSYA